MGQFIGVWSFAVAATVLACSTVCHAAGTEKIIYNFTGGADGGYPLAGLTKAGAIFYGTTTHGGAYGYGTVFSITETGTYSVIYSFKGYPDAFDVEWPMLYKDGALYGLSFQGGEGEAGDHHRCKRDVEIGCGTIFKITPHGQESIVYAFSDTQTADGYAPVGTLVTIGDTFYGATRGGGSGGYGTVFSYTKSGTEKVLYGFSDDAVGGPFAGLSVMSGVLYGTTAAACSAGQGEAFSITPEGTFTALHTFQPSGDGYCPLGPLLPLNGILYGTTEYGGAYDRGAIYTLTTDGAETIITSTDRFASRPLGNLLLRGQHLYSLARGGTFLGSLFRAAIAGGKFTNIHKFVQSPDGAGPCNGLVSSGGRFYGTTDAGGTANHGTVFEITP